MNHHQLPTNRTPKPPPLPQQPPHHHHPPPPRSPEMSQGRLDAMFARAKAAGMYPYGASPEQIHIVEHQVRQYDTTRHGMARQSGSADLT